MTGMTTTSGATRTGAGLFLAACVAFVVMGYQKLSPDMMAIPAAIGWAAALYALRPLVPAERLRSLYFAFGVMAFLIFFLHETYGYHGKVRTFPLLVGWAGVVLSVLDIVSVTETRLGHGINVLFGSAAPAAPSKGLSVRREIACFVAMGAGVVLIYLVGFLIASPVFVFLWMWLWGRKPILRSLYGGIFTFAFIWLLFEVALEYELYRGVLVEWALDMIEG